MNGPLCFRHVDVSPQDGLDRVIVQRNAMCKQLKALGICALRDRIGSVEHEGCMCTRMAVLPAELLDDLDGDPDLEPSLGSAPAHEQVTQQAIWAHGATDDREQECEDEGYPNADSEPSLGWPETGSGRQSLVHTGAYYDREMDCEDEGAQCDDEGCTTTDDEPALGWTLDGNRGNSFDEDLEHDPADMGEPEDAF